MKFVGDILDLVVAIFVLGLTISVSFTVVLPIFYEDKNQVALVDKTSPEFLGYDLQDDYDGTMSYLQVVLATQIQDYNLPEPRVFTVATDNPDMVRVDSTYNASNNLDRVKNTIVTLLNREGTYNSKYIMRHNYGLSTNNSTNLTVNGDMEQPMVFDDGTSPWSLGGTGISDATPSQVTSAKAIAGNYSIAITTPSSDSSDSIIKDVYFAQTINSATPNAKYQFSADVYCENCSAVLEVQRIAEDGSSFEVLRSKEEVKNNNKATYKNLKLDFEISNNIKGFVIKVVKTGGEANGSDEVLVIDNVEFKVFENSDPFYEFVRVN